MKDVPRQQSSEANTETSRTPPRRSSEDERQDNDKATVPGYGLIVSSMLFVSQPCQALSSDTVEWASAVAYLAVRE